MGDVLQSLGGVSVTLAMLKETKVSLLGRPILKLQNFE